MSNKGNYTRVGKSNDWKKRLKEIERVQKKNKYAHRPTLEKVNDILIENASGLKVGQSASVDMDKLIQKLFDEKVLINWDDAEDFLEKVHTIILETDYSYVRSSRGTRYISYNRAFVRIPLTEENRKRINLIG